jgi:uracil-DNA glycosylase family protein
VAQTALEYDASPFVPQTRSLEKLREAVQECRGCPLYEPASQAVFGEGLARARVVFVGEVPGDKEDLEGKPFVGPAGKELDRGLDEVGIDRKDAYITNVVKHFKFQERGKRRIHQKPNAREEKACRPWLDAELEQLKPDVFVCLGATAAQALLGRDFRITRQRGEWVDSDLAPKVMATAHPSSIIRERDDQLREEARREFQADLTMVAKALNDSRA